MTTAYRQDPEPVPECTDTGEMSVCVWCKYIGHRSCDQTYPAMASERNNVCLKNTLGRNPVTGKGWLRLTEHHHGISLDNDGRCTDFHPTILTQLLRLFGFRKAKR